MKVVHINKTDTGGGASVAAHRLHNALLKEGIDSYMLVEHKKSNGTNIVEAESGRLAQIKAFGRFVGERLTILPSERSLSMRYNFSIANTGLDISQHPLVQDADIIHLHWINQGYLSMQGLQKLFELGKPVVWTLHDMWAFSGGCHYAGSCLEYAEHCGYCPLLRNPSKTDLSQQIFQQKKSVYGNANLTLVACSHWLCSCASGSVLFRHKKCVVIPNPIERDVFCPRDKSACRMALGLPTDKKLLLFGAAKLSDIRKGYRYLSEALRIISDSFPLIAQQIELVVFGKVKGGKLQDDGHSFRVHSFDFVRDRQTLVNLYNAADAFVLPSLQDNLPNTVMESLACGTPVVGFRIGGVPEMVEHEKVGYMAEVKNSLSLANGIVSTLLMGFSARQKEISEYAYSLYDEKIVAKQYISTYRTALANRQ
mgnify:CR=1 FL=1